MSKERNNKVRRKISTLKESIIPDGFRRQNKGKRETSPWFWETVFVSLYKTLTGQPLERRITLEEMGFEFLKELGRRLPIVRGAIKGPLNGRAITLRLLAVIGFWFVCYLINVTSSTIAARRFVKGREVLPDFIMQALPLIPFAFSDAYFIVWVAFSVMRLMIFSEQGLFIFFRNFTIYGVVLATRGLFLNLSLLPDPNPDCLNYVPHVQMYAPFDLSCSDQMFSGHTAMWTILALCYFKYEPSKWMKLLGGLGLAVGALVLIASRTHYTIDVAVGFWVTTSIWLSYYFITRNLTLPDYKNFAPLAFLEDQLPRETSTSTLPLSRNAIPTTQEESSRLSSSSSAVRDVDEARMLILSTPLSQRTHATNA